MKEISMTRILKPFLNHRKEIRKITKYYDEDFGKEMYRIYLKRGCVSCYESCEIDETILELIL